MTLYIIGPNITNRIIRAYNDNIFIIDLRKS